MPVPDPAVRAPDPAVPVPDPASRAPARAAALGRAVPVWAPLAVLLTAALVRLVALDRVPPGFQFDEAHNAIDAARVLAGEWRLFFPDNGGREPANIYLYAASLAVLGRDNIVLAIRLVSAMVGLVSVAVLAGCATRMLRGRLPGLLAAGLLATNYWHLHFSRFGIRAVLAPLWTTAVLWCWFRATSIPAPPGAGGDAVTPGAGGDAVTPGAGGDAVPRRAPWRRCHAGRRWRRRHVDHRECAGRDQGRQPCRATTAHATSAGRRPPSASRVGGAGSAHGRVPRSRRLLTSIRAPPPADHPDRSRSVSHAGRPRAARAAWRALVVSGATAFVLFVPLGAWFAGHPEQFTAHPSDVSLAAVAAAEYGGSVARALLAQVAAVGGMAFFAGDPSAFHNLPGLPVFDPLTALCAVIGIGVLLGWLVGRRRARRDTAVLLGLWLLVGLVPTLLSDRPPNYSRAMAALPPLAMLPALGLTWLLERRPRAGTPFALAAGLVVVGAAWTGYHYFVAFPRLAGVTYSYDADKVEAYRALAAMSEDAEVFLHPLWTDQATFAFLNDDDRIRSLDGRDSVVLPADGRDALIAFPAKEAEREEWYDRAKSLYGDVARRARITDTQGAPLLRTLRVPATAAGDLRPPRDAPLEPATFVGATFAPPDGEDLIRLVGYTAGPARPGEPLAVVLVWEALAPIGTDLTVFTHIVGAEGSGLGQDDREPAHASYRTSAWRPGDIVIDRFEPVLDAAAAGVVHVALGWYDLATGERLLTADGADSVTLGPFEVGE